MTCDMVVYSSEHAESPSDVAWVTRLLVATCHSTLVLTNYSEITNQEAFFIEDTAERGITREQLAKIAHVLTDGLAGAETRMIGIIGLHQKAARERHFPLDLLEKGLKVYELAMSGRLRMLQFSFAVFAKPGEFGH
eukprot:s4640_g2.t1